MQFCGAFNDNAFKIAVLTIISFSLSDNIEQAQTLQAIGIGIFTLPYLLFSAIAGQVADKFEKSLQIRIIKLAEIFIMVLGISALLNQSVYLMMLAIFLMGLQSTFFGPLKYSILPDHLKTNELIGGNGLIESSTFLAILFGNIFGAFLMKGDYGLIYAAICVMSFALIGFISSLFIPKATIGAPNLRIDYNSFKQSWWLIKKTSENKTAMTAAIAISWFWLVGTVFLTELPSYTQAILYSDERVFSLLLACFTIGIASGSLIVNSVLKAEISFKLVPIGLIGIALFTIDLFFASQNLPLQTQLLSITEFLSIKHHLRILFDLFFISFFGGFYVVPLYAALQHHTAPEFRSRTIACNNILNALFMVLGSIVVMILANLKISIPSIFLITGLATLGFLWIFRKNKH